ncbi:MULTISPECIES: YihY/virulence factor BrkB family protein [Salegentibacter]|uniref:YihY/virulence factor BrkB family protein n=1 Tax=Salegentibacter maritimus TaxID=2794347 RepID=A0ABS0TD58_9FLAO|nr:MULTISPECIES: YihY/virulence factor BrkB family protein [Salegentibacter]MBE7638946.1 YihY family inner membrane protein [Salegentibacter sp. BLCTC]MBI6115285.1 YihY/virulence factor BrkB family protein [Salegentibacter maritimus]MBI6118970.1 YihY/virulence factor BrkB family protein [Salegentibacter maritimus]
MAPKKALLSKIEQFSNWWENTTKGMILPGFDGLSFYDLWEIYSGGIIKGTFSTRASAIAFSFFMALFPFLLFMLNLIPYINFIDDFQLQFLIFMDSLLPPNTSDFFNDIFLDIANTPRGGLLSLAFIISIFLMTNGVNAIFTGFEFSYHTNTNRSIVRQYLVAVGVSLIMALLLLLTVILAVYLTYAINDFNNLGVGFSDFSAAFVKYLVFVLLIYTAVATLYYFGTKEARQARFFSIGAFFTTFLILIFTYLFGLYIENFSTYNELYGSIGALLILMVYIWLNSNILLLGFELNASLIKMKKKIK